jgi:hypothetical protein
MVVAWSLLFAGLALSVLGVVLWLWLGASIDRSKEAELRDGVPSSSQVRIDSRFNSPSQEAALDLVQRALRVREPGKVAEFFRMGSASAEAVADFLRNREQVDGRITDYSWLSSMDANGLLLDGVVVISQATGSTRSRLALLTPDDKGTWRIDFDAFAQTATPAWSELMDQPNGQGTVRVVFVKDTYFNGPFRDETRWTCYRLSSPDLAKDLLAYCRKDSPQELAMARIDSEAQGGTGDHGPKRATLEIRRVADKDSRQCEITRVLAEDWVLSATPFDANFK